MTTTISQPVGDIPSGLISLKSAASLIGVDAKTIRNWISAGQLRGYRVNNRLLRVDRDELQNLIQPVEISHAGGAK